MRELQPKNKAFIQHYFTLNEIPPSPNTVEKHATTTATVLMTGDKPMRILLRVMAIRYAATPVRRRVTISCISMVNEQIFLISLVFAISAVTEVIMIDMSYP